MNQDNLFRHQISILKLAYNLNNCSSAISKLSAFSDSLALSNSNSVCKAIPDDTCCFVVLTAPYVQSYL